MFNKIMNWASGALLASAVLVFTVTLNPVYIFSAMIFGGIVYGIKSAREWNAGGEVNGELLDHCWTVRRFCVYRVTIVVPWYIGCICSHSSPVFIRSIFIKILTRCAKKPPRRLYKAF
jgi:hypothetical protein